MKKLTKKHFFILVLLSFSGFLFSCSDNPTESDDAVSQWTRYTTSDGLPVDAIGAITVGPDGDVWCVPLAEGGLGVAHFDGETWTHYTTHDGLGSNALLWMEHSLALSPDGDLWAGTFGGGVSHFNGEVWTTYTTTDGLLSNNVTAVAVSPDGDLYCGHPAPDCGISRFDGETWTAYTANDMGVSFCNITSLEFDQDGILWAGGGIVLRYDGDTWTSFTNETGMPQPIALYMDIGPDDRVWIGGNGISCYDGTAWTHFLCTDIGATSEQVEMIPLAVDSGNVVWVGLSGYGMYRHEGESWKKFTPGNGPSLKNVFSITVAPDGAIWFGTETGIYRYIADKY